MVTINNSSLHQDVFETIYDLFTAHAVASSFNSSVQPTITASYIDKVPVFPQIVVEEPAVEKNDSTFNRSNFNQEIMVAIDIYTSGQSKSKDRAALSSDVETLLEDNKISGLTLIDISTNPSISNTNDNKVLNTVISVSFRRRA